MSKTTKTPVKKVSRRDALKLLTAVAGATALANTPARWNKPDLKIGVLPVHAQTSTSPFHILVAGPDNNAANYCQPFSSTAAITPADPGISLNYAIALSNGATVLTAPGSLNGTVSTDGSGNVSLTIAVDPKSPFTAGDTITVIWSFANPADGTGSDSQVFTSGGSGCPGAHTIAAGQDVPDANYCWPFDSTAAITPADAGISLNYAIALSNSQTQLTTPASPNGTLSTGALGDVSLTITVDPQSTFNQGDTITVTWSFTNPADGTGTASQVFTLGGSGC